MRWAQRTRSLQAINCLFVAPGLSIRACSELNQLQQGEIGSQLEVRRIERYQIFLALSLALLVISMLIPDRVSNRKMAQRRNVMMGEKEFAA